VIEHTVKICGPYTNLATKVTQLRCTTVRYHGPIYITVDNKVVYWDFKEEAV
jgi:hypothetical protein